MSRGKWEKGKGPLSGAFSHLACRAAHCFCFFGPLPLGWGLGALRGRRTVFRGQSAGTAPTAEGAALGSGTAIDLPAENMIACFPISVKQEMKEKEGRP